LSRPDREIALAREAKQGLQSKPQAGYASANIPRTACGSHDKGWTSVSFTQQGNFAMDVAKPPNPTSVTEEKTVLFKIEPSKIIDLIISKQTQYYTLWAVYTAVQFAAGNYGSNQPLSLIAGLAVLAGVWIFNLGHLGFVLQCVDQLNRLSRALSIALRDAQAEDQKKSQQAEYQKALRDAFEEMHEGSLFWNYFRRAEQGRSYITNTLVHLGIDVCASIALLIRVKWI
jgi:hypothetical protein